MRNKHFGGSATFLPASGQTPNKCNKLKHFYCFFHKCDWAANGRQAFQENHIHK